jgi:hypothetical protein
MCIVTKYVTNVNIYGFFDIEKQGDKLGQPRRVLVCWACGSDRDVLTVHKAGGVLGVCDRCQNGGQP